MYDYVKQLNKYYDSLDHELLKKIDLVIYCVDEIYRIKSMRDDMFYLENSCFVDDRINNINNIFGIKYDDWVICLIREVYETNKLLYASILNFERDLKNGIFRNETLNYRFNIMKSEIFELDKLINKLRKKLKM